MILKEATIKYKGYDPYTLSKGSSKKICCSCDVCGRVRYVGFKDYSNLCKSCAHRGKLNSMFNRTGDKNPMFNVRRMGKNNPNWKGKNTLICQQCGNEFEVKHCHELTSKFCSEKCKNKDHSKNMLGNNNPNWKGGISYGARLHILLINKCIKLNKRFNDSEFHHITRSIGVFIPKELHQHIRHNLRTGKNMGEINLLSLQFINGEL